MAVLSATGTSGAVEALIPTDRAQRMHNLEVDAVHTYFVGVGQWVVHNCRFSDRVENWISANSGPTDTNVNNKLYMPGDADTNWSLHNPPLTTQQFLNDPVFSQEVTRNLAASLNRTFRNMIERGAIAPIEQQLSLGRYRFLGLDTPNMHEARSILQEALSDPIVDRHLGSGSSDRLLRRLDETMDLLGWENNR
ncbi:hypothetical protein HC928_11220 [bacterium]|nr:hypothetical protein [bacterium]